MSLLAIAYPHLSSTDFEMIQSYRKEHDELYYNVVPPHFTLVFAVAGMSSADFTTEIKRQLFRVRVIPFAIRCATINKDAFSSYYHTFLVPDEGNGKIIKLHDKLYSGALSAHHRLDIDYIPHIGIGNSKDKIKCKRMVDEWNKKDFAISGALATVDIIRYENSIVTTIDTIELAG